MRIVSCHSNASRRACELIRAEMVEALGHLQPRRIVVKPNWVLHETDPSHPIAASVTAASVIAETTRAAAGSCANAERIRVWEWALQRAAAPVMM